MPSNVRRKQWKTNLYKDYSTVQNPYYTQYNIDCKYTEKTARSRLNTIHSTIRNLNYTEKTAERTANTVI